MISITDLTKTFKADLLVKPKEALRGVSLQVSEGDLFGFIGPNGAGKSTTIKIILGLIKKSSGSVSILGDTKLSASTRNAIGYLPEHPYFYDYLSGRELLHFYGGLFGLKGKILHTQVDELCERLFIDNSWADKALRTYSKGMVQKIGLAQSIINKPKLLILDEPMSGLDPVARKQVRQLMLDLNQQGTTIFYSSHVLSDVESVSNKIALLIDGKVHSQGSMSEILGKESVQYTVSIEKGIEKLKNSPFAGSIIAHSVTLHSIEERNTFLSWALENAVEIGEIDKSRNQLEELLLREVSNVTH